MRDYVSRVLRQFWAFGIGAVGGVVGIILDVSNTLTIPPEGWIAMLLLTLFIAQFLAFREMRTERDQVGEELLATQRTLDSLTDHSRLQAARARISKAVERGQIILDHPLTLGESTVQQWEDDVLALLQEVARPECWEEFRCIAGQEVMGLHKDMIQEYLRRHVAALRAIADNLQPGDLLDQGE